MAQNCPVMILLERPDRWDRGQIIGHFYPHFQICSGSVVLFCIVLFCNERAHQGHRGALVDLWYMESIMQAENWLYTTQARFTDETDNSLYQAGLPPFEHPNLPGVIDVRWWLKIVSHTERDPSSYELQKIPNLLNCSCIFVCAFVHDLYLSVKIVSPPYPQLTSRVQRVHAHTRAHSITKNKCKEHIYCLLPLTPMLHREYVNLSAQCPSV